MGNIMDYLDWRGDITFEQSPFNEVDNVILAQLAYVNFRDIIPSPEEKRSITLKEASQMFFDMYTENELKQDKSFISEAPFLMKKAAASKRFGNLILSNYVDTVDETLEKQFGAFHIRISPKYALGILTSQEGVEPEGTITELKSVYDKVISGISAIQTDDKKIQQLIAITSDYEVTDKFDEQMNELYHMGYNDKNI